MMNEPKISDRLLRYLADRDEERRRAVQRTLDGLTDREQALIREASIMGYVQGVRAAGAYNATIPSDSEILRTVVDACLKFSDLYPTIANYEAPDDE